MKLKVFELTNVLMMICGCDEKLINVMLNNSEEGQENLNRTLEAICR